MCADQLGHSPVCSCELRPAWQGGRRATLLFGVDDETHQDVGTDFDPYWTKAKGNQDLLPWLGAGLHPNTGFEPRVVNHPDGRVAEKARAIWTRGSDWSAEVCERAVLLLGRPESSALLTPAVARISWILKDDHNRERDYEHIGPFLLAGDRLLERVRNLTVRALPNGTLSRRRSPNMTHGLFARHCTAPSHTRTMRCAGGSSS